MSEEEVKDLTIVDTINPAKIEFETGLNQKQELFCELYATNREFFGNGVESYLEAYDPPRSKPNWYDIACASASRLLRNEKVSAYINHLLEMRGLNDNFVDKQLEFLITQHSDFKTKLGSIHEYNVLKRRLSGDKPANVNILVVTPETLNRYVPPQSPSPSSD